LRLHCVRIPPDNICSLLELTPRLNHLTWTYKPGEKWIIMANSNSKKADDVLATVASSLTSMHMEFLQHGERIWRKSLYEHIMRPTTLPALTALRRLRIDMMTLTGVVDEERRITITVRKFWGLLPQGLQQLELLERSVQSFMEHWNSEPEPT